MNLRRVFFEPWALGDALIAAATLQEEPAESALACNPRWHPLIAASVARPITLLSVEVPYTVRSRRGRFQFANEGLRATSAASLTAAEVLSIRGDFRDYLTARNLFPKARVRVSGWIGFAAYRSPVFDFPFARGWLQVKNRYRAWAKLAGVPFERVERTYRDRQRGAPRTGRAALHVGAQWQSKQYPEFQTLCRLLEKSGYAPTLLAGPGDALPPDVNEQDVRRVADRALVEQMVDADCVITNDSGPMHIAAMLGCRTLAIVRTVNIQEWIPPCTQYIASSQTPRGYRPHPQYMSDQQIDGWPRAQDVVARVLAVVREENPATI